MITSDQTVLEPPRARLRLTDRRRHQRVAVSLLGRYMLPNRLEYPCQTLDISPGGALLTAPVRGAIGDRIIVYFEHLGRVEGEITRHIDEGFAISIVATLRKRDKIANQLTWLANRNALGLPEDRRHERIIPRNPVTVLRFENGREKTVRIVDISLSGVAITIENGPALGTAVTIGSTHGKVVRRFDGGVAIEFFLPLSPDRFDDGVVL